MAKDSGEIEPEAFRAMVADVRSGSDDTPNLAMKAAGQAGTPFRNPDITASCGLPIECR